MTVFSIPTIVHSFIAGGSVFCT